MRLNNPKITLQSSSSSAAPTYNITTSVASATLDVAKAIISRNTFGTSGQQRNKKGRFDGSLVIDFDQDFSTSAALSRVLFSYLIADYPINVVVTVDNDAAVSATNPKYSFQAAVDSMPVIDGDADSGATGSMTMPIHGEVAESTTP